MGPGALGGFLKGRRHDDTTTHINREDSHALCLAALDHSKEEIRSHYDTYVSRIDTSLLMLLFG